MIKNKNLNFVFRIGRNVARSLWDYYKILGVIPLDAESVTTSHGADKNGACVRSFNLLRFHFSSFFLLECPIEKKSFEALLVPTSNKIFFVFFKEVHFKTF